MAYGRRHHRGGGGYGGYHRSYPSAYYYPTYNPRPRVVIVQKEERTGSGKSPDSQVMLGVVLVVGVIAALSLNRSR